MKAPPPSVAPTIQPLCLKKVFLESASDMNGLNGDRDLVLLWRLQFGKEAFPESDAVKNVSDGDEGWDRDELEKFNGLIWIASGACVCVFREIAIGPTEPTHQK